MARSLQAAERGVPSESIAYEGRPGALFRIAEHRARGPQEEAPEGGRRGAWSRQPDIISAP